MLSILIPIYNYKVVKLVKALKKQCERQKIMYEIVCFDDGSSAKIKHVNSELASYFGVNYTELSQNLGRARIRNWLAKSAAFENLLFLDCDSKVIHKDFIKSYLSLIDDYEVVSGGRTYGKKPPRAKSKRLHWVYGVKRESKKAKFRNKNSIQFFHSNNFLVKRDIVIKYPFDEAIKGYGYEDLLWAKLLFKKGIKIVHIDNEVEHLGLEKSEVFLKKTQNAIDNLKRMRAEGEEIDTRLISFIKTSEKWKIKGALLKYYDRNEEKIMSNLHGLKPNVYYLDLFKYRYYLSD